MFVKHLLILLFCFFFTSISFPNTENNVFNKYNLDNTNDYVSSNEINDKKEGRLSVKLRLGAGFNNAELKSEGIKKKKLIEHGFIAEGSSVLFFNDNIATELFVGVHTYKVSQKYVDEIKKYNTVNNKKGLFFIIPIGFMFQYHIAPFGAVRPYVGGGYNINYALFSNKALNRNVKTNFGHGGVMQLGIDFIFKDDSILGLDLKKYWLSYKLKDNFNKLKMNTLTITVCYGYNF